MSRRSRGFSLAVAFMLAFFGDGALARDVPHAALSFESGDLRRWNSDGFLKYHHLRVTRGEIHWDYELFRVAPRVLAAVIAAKLAGCSRAGSTAWVGCHAACAARRAPRGDL